MPTNPGTMTRKGYSFAGWYTGAPDENGVPTGVQFSFNNYLTKDTTVYAKWDTNEFAQYTIIYWTQNVVDTSTYEVAGTYIYDLGQVGTNIPYVVVDNMDEDYVVVLDGNDTCHYKGFCVSDDSRGQEIIITPEGDAVMNIYFKRIVYKFKFYIYRERNDATYPYQTAIHSGTGSDLDGLVRWWNWDSYHPGVTEDSGLQLESEQQTFNGTNYTYHYFFITAYYEQDISNIWPRYDQQTGYLSTTNGNFDGRDRNGLHQPVSYVMMVGTKLKPNATDGGSGTVKGVVTIMDDNILGRTYDANGNYVIVRYPDNSNDW